MCAHNSHIGISAEIALKATSTLRSFEGDGL